MKFEKIVAFLIILVFLIPILIVGYDYLKTNGFLPGTHGGASLESSLEDSSLEETSSEDSSEWDADESSSEDSSEWDSSSADESSSEDSSELDSSSDDETSSEDSSEWDSSSADETSSEDSSELDSSSADESSDTSSEPGDGGGGSIGGGDHLKGKATLNRVKLTGYRLEGGTMVEFTDHSTMDFSGDTSENLFGIQEGEMVVPGCRYEATMTLSNEGDFTLDYWMEVRMTSGFNTALAEQLKVTLTVNGIEHSTTVGQPMGDPRAPLGQIKKGEKVTFTISVEFMEHENNNAAQGQTVAFDLYVTTAKAT